MVDPTSRIILSTQRYQQAPRTDQFINVPLEQTSKNLVEFDRSVDLNLAEVFDQER
jgi:DNA polymerase III epsilon subunit-like protein